MIIAVNLSLAFLSQDIISNIHQQRLIIATTHPSQWLILYR